MGDWKRGSRVKLKSGNTTYYLGDRNGERAWWLFDAHGGRLMRWCYDHEIEAILDPREPEAVPPVAPTHDGQANTSGIVAERPPGMSPNVPVDGWRVGDIVEVLEWTSLPAKDGRFCLNAGDRLVATGFDWDWIPPRVLFEDARADGDSRVGMEHVKFIAHAEPPETMPMIAESLAGQSRPDGPTMLDVAEGVVRWWLADPTHRRVNISGQGHTLDAWTTTLGPAIKTVRTGWRMPDTAENAHRLVCEQHGITCPHAEVTVARNPAMTFPLDTGETK